ncbi:hypothetical protein GFS24_11910 [Chitinophaga sp. SYP-B3965]|uniref:DUF7009 family protein n=1 Tax=Chitinophaga sp. SYP-B3965 TaxID=2663120 RepID=UPI0012995AA7|nr:hypothetical protein [Chitinophaga sp. SYP-B3965]MRG45824.1 hypothetical protein [Chitinophaga sp. SYP-B3965]
MKIRIRGNSIRYRLDKLDIQALKENGKVEEETHIGPSSLHFCIRISDKQKVKLEGSAVHMSILAEKAAEWIDTDQVGIQFEQQNPDNSVLKILIEKDFKCLTEREEDDSSAFENPLAQHDC